MPHVAALNKKIPLALLKDYDFSSVTKENAKFVWFWEIARQYMADGYEPIPKGEGTLAKQFLATPATKLTTKELSDWYAEHFGYGRLPTYVLKDGTVTVKGDIRPLFQNATTPRAPIPPRRRFAFDISEFVPPQDARKYVLTWFDLHVAPQLKHLRPRTGPKSDHLSWLADLAVYRASQDGGFRKMFARLTGKLPKGNRDSLFQRSHQTDAKRRTIHKLEDIHKNTMFYSPFGIQS